MKTLLITSFSFIFITIAQAENRLKEAKKLGFLSAFAPSSMKLSSDVKMNLVMYDSIDVFVENHFGSIDEE